MPPNTLTGITKLDEDLKGLFEFAESKKLDEAKRVLSDPKSSFEDLIGNLGKPVIRLAIALQNDLKYGVLLHKCSLEARESIERARNLVKEHLSKVPSHPAVIAKAVESTEDGDGVEQDKGEQVSSLGLNPISRITPAPILFRLKSGKIAPSVRIGLVNSRQNERLLDTTLDWEDILFVLAAFMEILADELDHVHSVVELSKLALPDKGSMVERLSSIREAWERVQRLAPLYGIESPSSNTED
jgi:hypothetical protein